jgi:hypothetical protein
MPYIPGHGTSCDFRMSTKGSDSFERCMKRFEDIVVPMTILSRPAAAVDGDDDVYR